MRKLSLPMLCNNPLFSKSSFLEASVDLCLAGIMEKLLLLSSLDLSHLIIYLYVRKLVFYCCLYSLCDNEYLGIFY
jgi:hypothetical protein